MDERLENIIKTYLEFLEKNPYAEEYCISTKDLDYLIEKLSNE